MTHEIPGLLVTTLADSAKLLIVIVNYRAARCVIDCLASLAPELADHRQVRVHIVDNASGDGSAAAIAAAIARAGWSGWAAVREAPINGGFAYGNNLVIREALAADDPPGLFWLLNPDTVVRPGAIAAILTFFERHPQAGAIGTAIQQECGKVWPFAFRFHSLLGEVESAMRAWIVSRFLARHAALQEMDETSVAVDWVSGASMVIRRAVFETVGLLDEDYFLYFEETDYFRRVAQAGWERWYVPDAVVMHISGQSTGLTASDAAARRVPEYWFASRRRYLLRNHGRLHAAAADLIAITGLCLWRIRCRIRRKPHGDAPYYLRDFIRRSTLLDGRLPANPHLPARATDAPRDQFAWRDRASALIF